MVRRGSINTTRLGERVMSKSHSHSTRSVPRRCSRCDELATKKRNQTNFCVRHYRIKQMIDDAKIDKKLVPTHAEMESLVDDVVRREMVCEVCSRKMNWLRKDGHSTMMTLQHDRSGKLRLICLRCNVRHQWCPGDLFYDMPSGHKFCRVCKAIKPFEDFYPHPRRDCKVCCISAAKKQARNRRKNANPR